MDQVMMKSDYLIDLLSQHQVIKCFEQTIMRGSLDMASEFQSWVLCFASKEGVVQMSRIKLRIMQRIFQEDNRYFSLIILKTMIKQRKSITRQSEKSQNSRKPGSLSSALRRNKFLSLHIKPSTIQIKNPQYQSPFIVNKYKSLTLNRQQNTESVRKSSYQQYRQNRKNKIKQKWCGIVSERKGKLKVSLGSLDKNTKQNRSVVIHSRNSTRGNNFYTNQSFLQPSFMQLNSKTTPIPDKFHYLFQLIQKNQLAEQPGLISLSQQKSLSHRIQDRKFRTRCCQQTAKINFKQDFRFKAERKECRPWSGKKNDFIFDQFSSLQLGI